MREIQKALNKGRKKDSLKITRKSGNSGERPCNPFIDPIQIAAVSNSTMCPTPPFAVRTNGKYPEWDYNGTTMRCYYAGDFWIDAAGQNVMWAFFDRANAVITQIKPLEVQEDVGGRFVSVITKGNSIKTYLNDAVKVLFPSTANNSGTNTTTWKMAPITPSSVIPNQPNKPKVKLLEHDGEEYGFYYKPIDDGKTSFCVSSKGAKAGGGYIDWTALKFNTFYPYKVYSDAIGRLKVKVKQQDGTWEEYDMATVVCTVFNGNPLDSNHVVKFKDGNVGNCDADNLYWG